MNIVSIRLEKYDKIAALCKEKALFCASVSPEIMSTSRVFILFFFLTCLSLLSTSCASVVYRHIPERNVSAKQRDSINRQFQRSEVVLTTRVIEMKRRPRQVVMRNDSILVASSVLYDTLRLSLDAIVSIRCIEDLPVGTVVAATAGGALGGFLLATAIDKSAQFPIGGAVIGGVLTGFAAIESSKETLYIIDSAKSNVPTR